MHVLHTILTIGYVIIVFVAGGALFGLITPDPPPGEHYNPYIEEHLRNTRR